MHEDIHTSNAPQAPSKTEQVIAKGVQHANLITTPGAGAHMAGYFLHPGVDLLHRITALFFSLVIVVGVYSMFDRPFGYAVVARAHESVISAAAIMRVAFGAKPDCTSGSERFTASAMSAMYSTIASIDAAMPSGLQHAPVVQRPCGQ